MGTTLELAAPAKVDLSAFASSHSAGNKLARAVWGLVWAILFRPSPRICHGWRRFLLKLFGAQVGRGVHVYPSAKVWAPWRLVLKDHSCLGPDVDCYCVAPIQVGAHAIVSQYSYLCAASHDHTHPRFPLIAAPIVIGEGAWVAADVFIGPGVAIGEGAVVGARSSVFRNVEPWTVVGGNPARFLKRRELKTG